MFSKNIVKILQLPKSTFCAKPFKLRSFENVGRSITISSEIQSALANGDPVVALESTIVTHGMPYPENLQMASKVENIIRQKGAIPATIAILNGTPHVGLNTEQLRELATSKNCIKVSRRDFPHILSKKDMSGGTTVSGTMLIANKAGISVFVTGGLGGVHRGAEMTMDISCDLTELGRTPIAVISAGIKSLLDIGKTLEYLETQGVCVVTYGSEKTFPAFFCSKSSFEAPYSACNATQAAEIIHSGLDVFNSGSGLLFGVPIPEEHSISHAEMETVIQQALAECDNKKVVGKHITPYVLSKINELSKGKSLEANMSLIENNAAVGADISKELANIRSSHMLG